MDETLKAPLGELAHVDVTKLQNTLGLRPRGLARFAPAGIGLVVAAVAVALYRWRRS